MTDPARNSTRCARAAPNATASLPLLAFVRLIGGTVVAAATSCTRHPHLLRRIRRDGVKVSASHAQTCRVGRARSPFAYLSIPALGSFALHSLNRASAPRPSGVIDGSRRSAHQREAASLDSFSATCEPDESYPEGAQGDLTCVRGLRGRHRGGGYRFNVTPWSGGCGLAVRLGFRADREMWPASVRLAPSRARRATTRALVGAGKE